jgi:hypothetical protein
METERPQMTSQAGAYALRTGLARLYARMRMPTPTPSGVRTHAQACTHRPINNIYCFSTVTMVSCRCLSVTLYVDFCCVALLRLIISLCLIFLVMYEKF